MFLNKNKKLHFLKFETLNRLVFFTENQEMAVGDLSESDEDLLSTPDLTDYHIGRIDQQVTTQEQTRSLRAEVEQSPGRFVVPIEIPRVEKPAFNFNREFWISSQVAPEVIAPEHRNKAVCMAHTSEMLIRATGSERALRELGFAPEDDAWMFKRDILQKGGGEEVYSMGDKYLQVQGSSIVSRTDTPSYHEDIVNLKRALEQASKDGRPITLQCFLVGSGYQGQVVKDYQRISAESGGEYAELATHIIYFLGKGFRSVEGAPQSNEKATDYLMRTLHIKPEFRDLVTAARIRVNGTTYTSAEAAPALSPESIVELEDFYFTHHFKGASRVNSFTELIGSGNFVPTSVIKLNTDILERKGYLLPESPKEGLEPIRCLYLQEGESLWQVFKRDVSKDGNDCARFSWYLDHIGFDASDVEVATTGIPVPDLGKLKKYVEIHGGLSTLTATENQERVDLYLENHPHDHIVFIKPGDYVPWNLVKEYFSDMIPPLSKKEQDYVLTHIDFLNPQIDLTLVLKDGKENFKSWTAGAYFWFNDDLIAQLKTNLEIQRTIDQVYVPDTLSAPSDDGPEKVEFSQHEKEVIENATADPEIRRLLILVLINEQKCGWVRNFGARTLDITHVRQETSVGMFQVQAVEEEYQTHYKSRYSDFESYRQALVSDDNFNAEVAVRRLGQLTSSYRSFLRNNGETVPSSDRRFITGVLSGYNRGPASVYTGMIAIAGQDVSDAFGLGLDASEAEIKRQTNGIVPQYVSYHMAFDYYGSIMGTDFLGVAEYWGDLAANLLRKGKIHLTPEQIAKDQATLERTWPTGNAFVTEYLQEILLAKHSPDMGPGTERYDEGALGAYLIMYRKNDFLNSELYKEIKKAYEAETAAKGNPQTLSMLITEQDYMDNAVQNYGFRVTRYEQLEDIENYSTPRRATQLGEVEGKWENPYDLCTRIQTRKMGEMAEEEEWNKEPPPILEQPDWWPENLNLTIDDGPSEDTERILDALDEKGVKATFYFVGVEIRDNPQYWPVLNRLVDGGHRIGYHSMYHDNFDKGATKKFEEMSEQEIMDDLEEFKAVLGIALEPISYTVEVGRCPGGAGTYSPRVKRAFQKSGLYTPHGWNNDTEDWKTNIDINPRELAEQSVGNFEENYTVLVHESENSNFADILPDYLDEIEALQN